MEVERGNYALCTIWLLVVAGIWLVGVLVVGTGRGTRDIRATGTMIVKGAGRITGGRRATVRGTSLVLLPALPRRPGRGGAGARTGIGARGARSRRTTPGDGGVDVSRLASGTREICVLRGGCSRVHDGHGRLRTFILGRRRRATRLALISTENVDVIARGPATVGGLLTS